jgi:hypothetical protein
MPSREDLGGRWLLDEVAGVNARDDLAEHWPFAARELALVLPPTIAAIRAVLCPRALLGGSRPDGDRWDGGGLSATEGE